MADRLPSNLFDDGDIWLPPDIFHNETASNFLPRHHHHHSRFCLDDLAHQFASLLLPNQHQNFPPNRELPRFPQLNTHVPVFAEPKPPSASHGGNGGAVGVGPIPSGFGNGSFSSGAHPVYVFPSHTQLDRDLETRARILKMQQNRLLRNRVGPIHGYGFGIGGGLVRESGGTGVFHPRIVDSSGNATRQGIRNRHAMEIQANEHLNSMTRLDFARQEESLHHHLLLPPVPEMGLPRSYNQY